MSREIKFRAWDGEKLIKEMAFIHILGNDVIAFREDLGEWIEDGVALMQFTGLKDKNGKEIYDGDILKSFSPSVPCYEVFYDRCCFRLRYKLKSGEYYDWGPLYRMEEIFLEGRLKFHPVVIGNCYENPELLTQPIK